MLYPLDAMQKGRLSRDRSGSAASITGWDWFCRYDPAGNGREELTGPDFQGSMIRDERRDLRLCLIDIKALDCLYQQVSQSHQIQ